MASKKELSFINKLTCEHKYGDAIYYIQSLISRHDQDPILIRALVRNLIYIGDYDLANYYINCTNEDAVYRAKTVLAIHSKNYELMQEMYNKYFINASMDFDKDFYLKCTLMPLLEITFSDDFDINSLDYKARQFYDYSIKEARYHILELNKKRKKEKELPFFNTNKINMEYLYRLTSDLINRPTDNYQIVGPTYQYYIKFPYLANDNPSETQSYIKVIAGMGYNEIIDMYPVLSCDGDFIDFKNPSRVYTKKKEK